jgi:putative tryptophan/tyrosine transport system substrate-binding protein
MRRRDFVAGFGFTVLCSAQASGKPPLIAMLNALSQQDMAPYLAIFRDGMFALGYAEGRDFEFVAFPADGDHTRLPKLAEELVRLEPRIIVGNSMFGISTLKRATSTIPIISPVLTDPVEFGLAESNAHPGGQVTGILVALDTMPAKQIEIAREAVSGVTRIGIFSNANNPAHAVIAQNAAKAAATLPLQFIRAEARGADDLELAMKMLVQEGVGIVFVLPDALFLQQRREIAALAISMRVPTLYAFREHVEAGGLISYGVDFRESFRRLASYADKILRGAKAADLPIEMPSKLETTVNMRTAKAIDITIPNSVLARADELIE